MKIIRFALNLILAVYYLFRLKIEFYVPPFSNLLRRDAKLLNIKAINITKYVPWDINKMVETLLNDTSWKTPNLALPMRFDCKLEHSFIDYSFRKTFGCTITSILCSNLIRDGIRTKEQMREFLEAHDNGVDTRVKEMSACLGINVDNLP